MRMAEPFFQDPPKLANAYRTDRRLVSLIRQDFGGQGNDVEADLERFGERVVSDVAEMAADADAHEPQLVSHDPWGRRIDRIDVSQGWRRLERVAAEEGLVAIGYERTAGARSRLHQFAKLYLFHPSSAVYTCPLAMTDGAARLIELYGNEELRREEYRRLTSRRPEEFWTSGQWMTERTGGSDVGDSRTVARPLADKPGWYELFGDKWFTSATTSQMAMTLARIEDESGRVVAGSRGLSLFQLRTRRDDGEYNGIVIHRLKDKLGTRAMPTAELGLVGARARLVGEQGQGVKTIASLMNITRVYNAICAVATMNRGLSLAIDYAGRRRAFGKRLIEQPLHVETLSELAVRRDGCFSLVFHVVRLLGQEETGELDEESSAVLRLLIPLVKLFSAKECVAATSEVLECFGGAGYVEDTGLPRLLRDAQVLSIWEGTTNILSLDALRAVQTAGALVPFLRAIRRRAEAAGGGALAAHAKELLATLDRWTAPLAAIEESSPRSDEGREGLLACAREIALGLAWAYTGSLLLEESARPGAEDFWTTSAARWIASPPRDPRPRTAADRRASLGLIVDPC